MALKEAKLAYLTNATGRTLAPAYWAGLIVMGDNSPITLTPTGPVPYAIIALIALALLAVVFYYIKKKYTSTPKTLV